MNLSFLFCQKSTTFCLIFRLLAWKKVSGQCNQWGPGCGEKRWMVVLCGLWWEHFAFLSAFYCSFTETECCFVCTWINTIITSSPSGLLFSLVCLIHELSAKCPVSQKEVTLSRGLTWKEQQSVKIYCLYLLSMDDLYLMFCLDSSALL